MVTSRKMVKTINAWKKPILENKKSKETSAGFCTKNFAEFCDRTDLHGYKYITMQDLNIVERCFWAAAVLVSIGCAAYFVMTAYFWYARNPIVTVIESTHGAIWDVPFPAVTICDVNLVSLRKSEELSQEVYLPDNVTSDYVFEALRISPMLYSAVKGNHDQQERLEELQQVMDLNNISVHALFSKIKPTTCNSLIERCMWKNTIRPCTTLFRPVVTQISFCCAFNLFARNLDADEQEPWSPSQPRRVSSCGYQTALTVLLHTDQDDYYSSMAASFGTLVLVDNAFNYPDTDSPLQLVNPSTEMFIALTPERTYSTPGVRAFKPKERPCYFKDEVSLEFFREYSYHNCLLYRKAMSLHKSCGCLPYYLLDEDNDENYRPCNFSDMDCLEDNEDQFKEHEPRDPDIEVMDCLPDCEHFDYPLEVSMGVLAQDAPQDGLAFFKDVDLANRSLINVFFNDLVTTRYRRDVYLNWQNLLASFGGLLSLMLGFTLISAIDFVIFFSFRFAHEMFNSLSTINANLQVADAYSQNKRQKINQLHVQGPRKPVTYADVNMAEKNVIRKY